MFSHIRERIFRVMNCDLLSVFIEGWLRDGKVYGRPVDVEILPDGSMLISDDMNGVIYLVRYTG